MTRLVSHGIIATHAGIVISSGKALPITPQQVPEWKGRVVNAEDLRSRFSVEVLTKEFYQELSDWYAWAIKIIRFPNDLNDKTDDDKFNNESAIRLITRLILFGSWSNATLCLTSFLTKNILQTIW